MSLEPGYTTNADFWTTIMKGRRDRLRNELTDAAVLSALGQVDGRVLLDAGCGEGYLSRELAVRGARVTGIDLNPILVETAAARAAEHNLDCQFVLGSLTRAPFDNESFDLCVGNHVMNDIEDHDGAIRELARVLRPGGRLVLLMLHPCFYYARSGLPEDDREWVELYFTNRVRLQRFVVAGVESPGEVQAWYRPLEAYASSLERHGLAITSLKEPHPPAETLQDDPWWRDKFARPLFLLITAMRL